MTDATIAAPAAPAAPVAAPAPPASATAALTEPAPAAPAPPAPASVTLPAKDADAAAWKTYYKAIGAPDAAGLELPMAEGGDKAFAAEAATQMAEVGLLPHQAKALAAWWNTKSSAALEAHKTETARLADEAAAAAAAKVNADDAALKNEWTPAKYDANIEIAKRAVRQFFPTDQAAAAIDALEKSLGYGATMRLMHRLGVGLGEGTIRGDGQPGVQAQKSLEERLYGPK